MLLCGTPAIPCLWLPLCAGVRTATNFLANAQSISSVVISLRQCVKVVSHQIRHIVGVRTDLQRDARNFSTVFRNEGVDASFFRGMNTSSVTSLKQSLIRDEGQWSVDINDEQRVSSLSLIHI